MFLIHYLGDLKFQRGGQFQGLLLSLSIIMIITIMIKQGFPVRIRQLSVSIPIKYLEPRKMITGRVIHRPTVSWSLAKSQLINLLTYISNRWL